MSGYETEERVDCQEGGKVMKERGCGFRRDGGLYAEAGTRQAEGVPIEMFLIDPPIDFTLIGSEMVPGISDGKIKLPSRGVTKIGANVFDVVGREHYPDVAGFISEGVSMGVSRRIPTTIDLQGLDGSSRLILGHARCAARVFDSVTQYRACMTGSHPEGSPVCLSTAWNFCTGEVVDPDDRDKDRVFRVGSTYYTGFSVSDEVAKSRLGPGLFWALPIERFVVVDRGLGRADETMRMVEGMGLDIEVSRVEE